MKEGLQQRLYVLYWFKAVEISQLPQCKHQFYFDSYSRSTELQNVAVIARSILF